MTSVAIGLSIAALLIALGSWWEARRSAAASERSAAAAEESNLLARAKVVQDERAHDPSLNVVVLRTWHLASDREGTEVGIEFVVENQSSEPDTITNLLLAFEHDTFSTDGPPELRPYSDSGAAERLVPRRLQGGERAHLKAQFRTRRLNDSEKLPGVVSILSARIADPQTSDFTVYQS